MAARPSLPLATRQLRHPTIVRAAFVVLSLLPALAGNAGAMAGQAPGSYRILSPDSVIRIPFDIYRGDIRMAAVVNGRPMHLLLDDGFMWDALLLWGGSVDSLGLRYDRAVEIGDSAGANAIRSRQASGLSVRFPGVEFEDQTAVVTPSSSGVGALWAGSEGQISAAFFKHFVVVIDFDEMVITLVEPAKFRYVGRGTEVPLRPLESGPSTIPAVLDLADGRSVSVDLMLDLGYNDQLQITTTGEHRIPVPRRSLAASLGMNIQGVPTLGFVGRVARVSIGGHVLPDVLAAFVSPEHSEHAYSEVMVGLGLLSRFNIAYDYPHRRMYLEPNRSFAAPFEYGMSGFASRRAADGTLEITEVYPESPASDAGLRSGDRISRIDGQPVGEMDPEARRLMLRQSGRTLALSVQRGGTVREVPITLRRVI